jgi:hypothetical protein
MKIGTQVKFKPEWMDEGDEDIVFTTVDAPEKGRVVVEAQLGWTLNPIQTVSLDMIDMIEVQK